MNDSQRIALGVLGTVSGWTLDHFAKIAGIVASAATAVFMLLSILEKIRALRRSK